MVQMKVVKNILLPLRIKLYIPHGSDERLSILADRMSFSVLYIPHGSDESLRMSVCVVCGCVLYIPHGSDESCSSLKEEAKTVTFISHMVQMKVNRKIHSM